MDSWEEARQYSAIEDRDRRIVQLEEVLRPAAALADIYGDSYSDEERIVIKLGWLRKARAALSPSEPPQRKEE